MIIKCDELKENGQLQMSWCGLLINIKTLEIQPDYSRYAGICEYLINIKLILNNI